MATQLMPIERDAEGVVHLANGVNLIERRIETALVVFIQTPKRALCPYRR